MVPVGRVWPVERVKVEVVTLVFTTGNRELGLVAEIYTYPRLEATIFGFLSRSCLVS